MRIGLGTLVYAFVDFSVFADENRSRNEVMGGPFFRIKKDRQKPDAADREREKVNCRANRRLVKRWVYILFGVDKLQGKYPHTKSPAAVTDRSGEINEHYNC